MMHIKDITTRNTNNNCSSNDNTNLVNKVEKKLYNILL